MIYKASNVSHWHPDSMARKQANVRDKHVHDNSCS